MQVINQVFEILPLCIIDDYYQKNIDIDNLIGTQFFKNNLLSGYEKTGHH
jgi:hypothetical protein